MTAHKKDARATRAEQWRRLGFIRKDRSRLVANKLEAAD
jgi:hypothetical protein